MSDSTCNTCGKSNYCPLRRGTYSDMNSGLFVCQSGGDTQTSADGTSIQWCEVAAGPGLLCIVIIIPTVLILLCVAGCVVCCRRRAAAQTLIVQPGIAMNPMGSVVVQGSPMPVYQQQQPQQQMPQQQQYSPSQPQYSQQQPQNSQGWAPAAAPAMAPPAVSQMTGWLQQNGLADTEKILMAAGASTVADLRYLSNDDIGRLGLNPVQRNKLSAAIASISM